MGVCYIVVLPAAVLLEVAYSDLATASLRPDGQGYQLKGTERIEKSARLPHIAAYINRSDAAFPNSIILAANFRQDTDLTEDAESSGDPDDESPPHPDTRWTVEERPDGCHRLVIPTKAKLAAIIDGQHRLFAFTQARHDRLGMHLVCSVYLDLPKPFQAQLFATINSTQKPVSKSLTYELFGYNIAEEEADYWTPDKLAVFLTRKLGTEEGSPLKGRIIVAPKQDDALRQITGSVAGWKVSTAVVVEGILRLYSSNPKRDSNFMLAGEPKKRASLKLGPRDRSPLREVYYAVNDKLIYILTLNYLKACQMAFWEKAGPESFIYKTVGIQALFDILRKLASEANRAEDIRVDYFMSQLRKASDIDFATDYFRNASGSGRSTIRRAIEDRIGT